MALPGAIFFARLAYKVLLGFMLRFAIVTDIHYGFDEKNKKGAQAPRLIENYIKKANKYRVDFSVDLGDRVIYKSPDRDRAYLTQLKDQFNKLAMPHYAVHGNHDLGNMTRYDNADILGVPAYSYSHDIGGVHFIFWSPNVRLNRHKEVHTHPGEIEWLEKDLAETNLPCVVFTHIPLDNYPNETVLNKTDPTKWLFPSHYEQGPKIRKVLEDSGKVMLCMAGHRHMNRHREINDIQYIIHQSLTQKNKNTGHARGAYSIVEITDRDIYIQGFGVGQPDHVFALPPFVKKLIPSPQGV